MPKFHEEFRIIVASDLYREGLGYIVIIEFVQGLGPEEVLSTWLRKLRKISPF